MRNLHGSPSANTCALQRQLRPSQPRTLAVPTDSMPGCLSSARLMASALDSGTSAQVKSCAAHHSQVRVRVFPAPNGASSVEKGERTCRISLHTNVTRFCAPPGGAVAGEAGVRRGAAEGTGPAGAALLG